MGLKQFERKLEQLVEGAFAKAFRSGLHPVEVGRRILREMDDNRQVGVRGITAPNHFTVWLSPEDRQRFESLETSLARELTEYAREHARQEGYHFVGGITIEFETDDGMKKGDLFVDAEVDDEGLGLVGSLVLPSGERVSLGDQTTLVGRVDECTVTLDDPKVSRRHAEIRPAGDAYRLIDLSSTNGTEVNGRKVSDQVLTDGDRIRIGDSVLVFEAS
ncbi:MAG TPA: DUF3662 and FHA domain-containing protein [Acidimicrobiia bacterium]|nr:DUF3662 and FHA domain-containing protein [Acidimicrobiia bacterium]